MKYTDPLFERKLSQALHTQKVPTLPLGFVEKLHARALQETATPFSTLLPVLRMPWQQSLGLASLCLMVGLSLGMLWQSPTQKTAALSSQNPLKYLNNNDGDML